MGPWVRLVTVDQAFEAKVIHARLGSDGVLCELRPGVDGPTPFGPFHVYVIQSDLELATALIEPVDDEESGAP